MDKRTGAYHIVNGKAREIRVDLLDEAMVKVYRSWTPAQRLRASDDQMLFVRDLLRGVIAGEHPEWSAAQINAEVARRILGDHV